MKRREIRQVAIQVLYSIEMNEDDVTIDEAIRSVLEDWKEDVEVSKPDTSAHTFLQHLVTQTWEKRQQLDILLSKYLTGWKPERLSRVDLQILRMGVFEMFFDEDTPPKVVINEAIELAKYYGTDDSGRFVNGVLGKMWRESDSIKEKLSQA